jgi:DNA invertase Pin-like site-specific DNA recombinase
MENAIAYCRVSTGEQSDSLPVQQQKCKDFATAQHLNLVTTFTDSKSGRTGDRPQFKKMLEFCGLNRKTIKHVIVSDLSRLARNVTQQGLTIAQLTNWGIRLHSVDEATLGDDATGKLGRNVIGAISQFFSDSLSERTKFRMAAAVKEGRFVWVSPVGYLNPKNGRGSVIKLNPERAPLVRKGFELMATGRFSADDVLRNVTALGLTTRNGAPVPRQTWHSMLKNPLYCGWVKSGDLMVPGVHEAIVPKEVFDEVQSVLAGNSRSTLPRQVIRPDFPLKQFVKCAKCDRGLTAGIIKKKFGYYWCYTKGCRAVLVSKGDLEANFITLLGMCLPTIEYLNRLPEIAARAWQAREECIRQDSRALTIRLNEQKRLNSQAIKAKLSGELSGKDFEAFKEEIAEKTEEIQRELNRLEQERKTLEELKQQQKLENYSFVETWRTAGIQVKLELQKALFPAGLVWSHETGFLNRKNKWLMEGLGQILQQLANPQEAARQMIVRFGVPDGI